MLVFLCSEAFTQEQNVAVYGWGGESCGRFIDIRRRAGPRSNDAMEQWVLGYVTAYNILIAENGDALNGLDKAAIMALVERLCVADPRLIISAAVSSVLREEESKARKN